MEAAPALEACQPRQGTKICSWLNVLPYIVSGTDMGDQEWHDPLSSTAA